MASDFAGFVFGARRWRGRFVCQSYKISRQLSAFSSAFELVRDEINAFRCRGVRSIMLTQIKFGTSGWRAVDGGGVYVRQRAARGGRNCALRGFAEAAKGARVIVGRDPRFLGETFCSMAAEILAAHGIAPLVVAEAAPTPAFAHAVIQNKADGVINFTASHNPPEYNGIKFSTPDGCPALPEVTKKIEAEILAGDNAVPANSGLRRR